MGNGGGYVSLAHVTAFKVTTTSNVISVVTTDGASYTLSTTGYPSQEAAREAIRDLLREVII